jgi:hypothetical protein
MPITKRPCSNCPFRKDGAGVQLEPGRIQGIVSTLLKDDQQTFVCHKTLDTGRMTCAGAIGLMSKLGRLPVIARLGLAVGVITPKDIEASSRMVIETDELTSSDSEPLSLRGLSRSRGLNCSTELRDKPDLFKAGMDSADREAVHCIYL